MNWNSYIYMFYSLHLPTVYLKLYTYHSPASCPEGSVRLLVGTELDYYNGKLQLEPDYGDLIIEDNLQGGRVEYCTNGSYGTVCESGWDNNDASVVCKQLGFSPFGKDILLTHWKVM